MANVIVMPTARPGIDAILTPELTPATLPLQRETMLPPAPQPCQERSMGIRISRLRLLPFSHFLGCPLSARQLARSAG